MPAQRILYLHDDGKVSRRLPLPFSTRLRLAVTRRIDITCDLSFPVAAEQALAWARQAQWFFRSYYKYAFVFEAYCTVAYPDDPEAHEVSALAEVCGETSGDIYRFQVQGPMTWDEISYPGTPELVIRDGDTELVRV